MLTYEKLKEAVATKGIFRITTRLETTSAGGLVFPPTYPNPDSNDRRKKSVHIFRQAWIEGSEHRVVVLDSPQSQANRVEDAFLEAIKRKHLNYPDIQVRVERTDGVEERYSVLQLSHRIYDAVLLATERDGIAFKQTVIGKAVYSARIDSAAGLFQHAPITLVLGGWDSHSGGGPLSAKMPRILTSEIIGVDALDADRGATKFDSMDIRKGPVLYKSKDRDRIFELEKSKAADTKKKDPSDFGFGSVPAFEKERGASIRYALQNACISLPAARRLGFALEDGAHDEARDSAGRTAVVALALYGICLQRESGYFLRSGCDLLPAGPVDFEIIGRSLEETETIQIDSGAAKVLLDTALAEAAGHGLAWREGSVTFEADSRLRTLVDLSRADRSAEED